MYIYILQSRWVFIFWQGRIASIWLRMCSEHQFIHENDIEQIPKCLQTH